jgi:glycosyltransferase involved in cell wall biosynthesis
MKTCLLIPTYNCSNTLGKLFRYLDKLKPQPTTTIFAENNSRDNTLWQIRKHYKHKPHKIIRVWFREDAAKTCKSVYEPIAHIRQLLLTAARHYNPDYSIFLDADVYPLSQNLISILTKWRKDIVGGSYVRMFPDGPFLASKWTVEGRPDLFRYYKIPYAELMEPLMTSAGCLCLSRKVVQDHRLNFYPLYGKDARASEDFGYCLKARELGYKVFLDGTAVLWHDLQQLRPKPWMKRKDGKYIDFKFGD